MSAAWANSLPGAGPPPTAAAGPLAPATGAAATAAAAGTLSSSLTASASGAASVSASSSAAGAGSVVGSTAAAPSTSAGVAPTASGSTWVVVGSRSGLAAGVPRSDMVESGWVGRVGGEGWVWVWVGDDGLVGCGGRGLAEWPRMDTDRSHVQTRPESLKTTASAPHSGQFSLTI